MILNKLFKQLINELLAPDVIKTRKIADISRFWYTTLVLLFSFVLVMVINQVFSLRIFGFLPITTAYSYYLIGIFTAAMFIVFPAIEKHLDRIPFYDVILFFVSLVVSVYFGLNAEDIIQLGWEMEAPPIPTYFSFIIWFLIIEAVRRTTGLMLALVCAVFSFYPLYCESLPTLISGIGFDIFETARNHAMGADAILGVPTSTLGTLLIGFLLFGVVLTTTGGGPFFLDIAQGLLGHKPGGPAKVAVLSSALFGSISGSAVANVVTTGSITIPAMKKTGIEPQYAAAVEACASTGGTIAPPIMGAAAFVMASFLGVAYAEVVYAAIIPAILYYTGLFFQIDFYSYRVGLKGMPKDELPSVKETFKQGWYYIFAILVLFYFLFVVRVDSWAPFYASALLIVLSAINQKTRYDFKKFIGTIYEFGLVVGRIVAMLAAIGLIIGALSRTGVALSFSRELVVATHDVFALLVTGALASFILGMGMVSVAVYIFLAIIMVPALVAFGINPMAAHFFVLYWGVVSFITPPVALASYTAAGIANSDPLKTGLVAMRMGMLLYVLPFFFVYNPALLAQGAPLQIMTVFVSALIGLYFISAGFEGYIHKIGALPWISRACFFVGGMMILLPETVTDFVGVGTVLLTFFLTKYYKNKTADNSCKELNN